MKFHCDQCKTKYSISDDRVRGKILKIRCKNCSAVVTVREPPPTRARSSVPAPSAVSSPLRSPAPSRGQTPQLEVEWYVSLDGEQEGPFSEEEAADWISRFDPEDELYCWQEGFDDWLSVDKVAQFKDLREEKTVASTAFDFPGAKPINAPAPPPVPPVFAPPSPAAAPLVKPAEPPKPAVPSAVSPAPTSSGAAASLSGDAFAKASEAQGKSGGGISDFDIGEASRIVDLPALMAQRGNAPAPGAIGTMGTMGAMESSDNVAAAAVPPIASDAAAEDKRRRGAGLWLPIAMGALLVGGIAAVLVYLLADEDSGAKVVRASARDNDDKVAQSTLRERVIRETKTIEKEVPVYIDRPVKTGPVRPKDKGGTTTNGKSTTNNGGDEVDLSGTGTPTATGPLDGDDIMRVYRKNQIAIKMCYESSLKKNPLLKVPKTWVNIEVGLDGRVKKVSIPTLNNELGKCLVSRIRRWKFRPTTQLFSSRFPVVFDR